MPRLGGITACKAARNRALSKYAKRRARRRGRARRMMREQRKKYPQGYRAKPRKPKEKKETVRW